MTFFGSQHKTFGHGRAAIVAIVYAAFAGFWIVASDRLLPDLARTAEAAAWLSTWKGLIFVAITSLLLYFTVSAAAPAKADARAPAAPRSKLLLAIFLVLAAAIVTVGYQVFRANLRSLEEGRVGAVQAITALKAQRVAAWQTDRLQDITAVARSHSIREHAIAWIAGDGAAATDLQADLAGMRDAHQLAGIALADARGNVLLSAGERVTQGPWLDQALSVALREGAGTSPIYVTGENGEAPARMLFSAASAGGALVAVALADVREELYSALSSGPSGVMQSDAALVRIENGRARPLPGLRAGNAAALAIPPQDGPEPSQVVRLTADGRAALASVSRVPGGNWAVVARLDPDEVYARAPAMLRNTLAIVLLSLSVAAWLTLALFRQQQALHRDALATVERERLALDRHFEYLTRFANDIILLLDSQGRILNCNDRALTAYGYSREELLRKSVLDLRPAALVQPGRRQFEAVSREGGLRFETWHRRGDGSEFPVEISSRSFDIEGERFVQSIIRDVTERKKAENELALSERRFRDTFELMPLGMAHVAADGRFLRVNGRLADLLGYPPEELLQLRFQDVTAAEDLPADLKQLEALLAGRINDYTMEKRYRRKDGGILWAQRSVSGVRDDSGAVDYLVSVVEDVGWRKRLESQLKRRNLLYRTLSETNRAIARAGSVDELLDAACRIVVGQAELPKAAITRYDNDEDDVGQVAAAAGPGARELAESLLDLHSATGVFPADIAATAQYGIVVINDVEGAPISAATRLACLRGGVRSFASFPLGATGDPEARLAVFSAEPGFFEGDTLDLLGDVARDLSTALASFAERAARTRVEERLAETGRRMTALIESAPVAIYDLDPSGRVLSLWNPAAEQLFGWRRAEVIGQRLPIVPATDAEQAQFDGLRDKVLRGEAFSGIEVTRRRRDGTQLSLSLSAALIDGGGGQRAVLEIAEDVTLRRRATESIRRARDELDRRVRERTAELAAARDRAEEADRTKTAFLANMSHELRTPLNSIIGFSSLLLSGAPGPLSKEQSKQLGIVRAAGERLLALIEDVLDMSRLQAVDAQLATVPVKMRETVLRAIDALVPQAASRGLVLRTEIESCTALAEPRRLEQVVTNLVVNAIKYTNSGEIVVSCRQRDNHVEVAVRDTGIGISREDQRRLFVPFARLNRADAGPDGTGLGLAISKRLVEAMRGRLQVSSDPGAGSTFTIRLEAAGEA